MTKNQSITGKETKWRLPPNSTLPIEIAGNTFSSGLRENHEHFLNKSDNCKAQNPENLVQVSALWLASHRDECAGALIPFVRERFPLTAMQAIEAVKLAGLLARDERRNG